MSTTRLVQWRPTLGSPTQIVEIPALSRTITPRIDEARLASLVSVCREATDEQPGYEWWEDPR